MMRKEEFSIGIIEPIGGHGGMDYYDYGLAMGLGANNVKVIYYTCNDTKSRIYHNVTTLLYFRNIWNRNFFIKVFKYLFGHYVAISDMKRRNIKIAHLHFFTFRSIDLLILWYAKWNKIKIISTIHDINSFDKKAHHFIEKQCFKFLDGIIVHNKSSLAQLEKKTNILIPKVIIPHGNYLPFIKDISKLQSKENEKFSLLFFGQIKKVKGLDVLLEAVSILKKKKIEVELTIAGKAWKNDLSEYKTRIEEMQIEDIVVTDFRYIPDDEVANFYKKTDLVVLPYKTIYQSGVLLLTMSYGKPVICSDLEPFKEIISHDENGFLFESENSQDLANKIQDIITNRSKLDRIKENSNLTIRNDYNWIKIGAATKNFYLLVDSKMDQFK